MQLNVLQTHLIKMKTEVNIAFCILHLHSLAFPLAVALLTSYLRLNAISTKATHQDEWQVYGVELYQLKGSGASLCFLLQGETLWTVAFKVFFFR